MSEARTHGRQLHPVLDRAASVVSWEGTITDVYRTRRWWFGLRRHSSTGEYRYYNHY
ncbi:MAG: hypothetical protein NTY46_11665 [Candidatus Sumerlaeota bacterium]|nr:hypothetical protein [Candidatus Sumerlaeota bacterium]